MGRKKEEANPNDPFKTNVRPKVATQFGTMTKSQQQTVPVHSFGTGTRDTIDKVHITEEHARYNKYCKASPGPVYYPKNQFERLDDAAKKKFAVEEKSNEARVKSGKEKLHPLAGNKGSTYIHGHQSRHPHYELGEKKKTMNTDQTVNGKFSTPGPGRYNHQSSMMDQVDSRKPTNTRAHFMRMKLENQSKMFLSSEHAKADFPRISPGPGAHDHKNMASLKNQVDSRKETLPAWGTTSEKRFVYDYEDRSHKFPGAGSYETQEEGAMFKQHISYKTTRPKYSFGTCERSGRDTMYFSPDHSKEKIGKNSPGPATVGRFDSMKKQVDSRKPTSSAWGFGTAPRFRYSDWQATVPGPGNYNYQ